MKKIRLIVDLYCRAVAKAEHASGRIGVADVKRRGQQVYEITYDQPNAITVLRHYGTTTLVLDMQRREILEWYGEGVSDRDSMNTLLDCLGMSDDCRFVYGPVMGFVLKKGGERHELAA